MSVKRVAELLACAPAPSLYGPQPPLPPLPTSTSAASPGSSPAVQGSSPASGAANSRLASRGAQQGGSSTAAIVIRGGTFSWRPLAAGSSSNSGAGSGGSSHNAPGSPPLLQPDIDGGSSSEGLVAGPSLGLGAGAGAAPGASSSSGGGGGVVLSGVDLEVPRGVLVAVTGEVGSGKSSLLGGILGELHRSNGEPVTRGLLRPWWCLVVLDCTWVVCM